MSSGVDLHLLYKVANAPVASYPFPHFFVQDVFPADFYARLQTMLPDRDTDVYVAFDVAFRADTTVAYDAFVERYAPHPLTDQALRLRDGR